jgi:small subunit ribosomal protein S6
LQSPPGHGTRRAAGAKFLCEGGESGMRTYEALFIVQPNAGEDEVQTMVQGVETLIANEGGTVVRSEIWGKRRLAYEVSGFSEGVYILIRFESSAEFPNKLESSFKLNEDVIRYIIVHFDEKTLRLEAEQQKRTEAQLAARSGSDDDDDDRRPRRSRERSEETARA